MSGRKLPPDKLHARAPEVAAVFDPLLQKHGVPLLSFDRVALNEAAAELGTMPILNLEAFITTPREDGASRASRGFNGPKSCIAVTAEARKNWEAGNLPGGPAKRAEDPLVKKMRDDAERRKSWPTN